MGADQQRSFRVGVGFEGPDFARRVEVALTPAEFRELYSALKLLIDALLKRSALVMPVMSEEE